MSHRRAQLSQFVLILGMVGAAACGGGDSLSVLTTGTLTVTTSTTGAGTDPDGFTVQLDAAPARAIASSASLEHTDVNAGNHTIQLAGLAVNCTVMGENPRSVTVAAGERTTVAFPVICRATTGSLRFTTTTTGPTPDPDGYGITIDGSGRGVLSVSGDVTVDNLVPGEHLVGLSGVAGNCQVEGGNLRTVAVTAGVSTTVDFAVTCAAPPANAGTIRITTATTGPDPDPNGYAFAVDGGATQPIGVNEATSLTNVTLGAHNVQLSGVATNCSIGGTNTQTVTVLAGATADVTFAITCSATTGEIRVSVSTSGSPVDADGYTVKLDGAEPGQSVSSGSVNFPGVPAGIHSVALTGVASNCSVTDGTPRSVPVTVGSIAEVTFAVNCTASTGSIRVTTATTGANPDDGYLLTVDDGTPQTIGINATSTIGGLAAGNHTVTLSGVAENCDVDGTNPRSLNVTAGSIAEEAFVVLCTAPPTGLGTWTPRAPISSQRTLHTAAVVQNSAGQYILYIIGGNSPSADLVEAYNATTDTWTGRASLPSGRYGMTAVTIDGKIYVAGGFGTDGQVTKTLYVYTPATDTWTRGAVMPVAGASNVSDVIGGKLYVLVDFCTGCTSQRLYRYDPATDRWTRLADPPREHANGAGANIDGKLYVAWGSTSSVDMYDPVTDSWSLKLTMTQFGPVDDFGGLHNSAAVNFNKKLYVIGGRNDDNSMDVTLAYDPVLNAWEDKAPMARHRNNPAAGKVKDAAGVLQILVVGGGDSQTGDDVTDTEAYTP